MVDEKKALALMNNVIEAMKNACHPMITAAHYHNLTDYDFTNDMKDLLTLRYDNGTPMLYIGAQNQDTKSRGYWAHYHLASDYSQLVGTCLDVQENMMKVDADGYAFRKVFIGKENISS